MNRSQCKYNQTETVNSARLVVWGMVILLTAVFLSGCATFSHAAEYTPYQGNDYRSNYDLPLDHEEDYRYRSPSNSDFAPIPRHRSDSDYQPAQRHRRFRPVSNELSMDDYDVRLKQLLSGEEYLNDRTRNRMRDQYPEQN